MRFKNNKGFTFIELLIALLIMGILSTLVISEMIYGFQTFNTSSGHIAQQYKVMNILGRIQKDISDAYEIGINNSLTPTPPNAPFSEIAIRYPDFDSTHTQKCWKFQDNALWVKIDKINDVSVDVDTNPNIKGSFKKVIDGIDTTKITITGPLSSYDVLTSCFDMHSSNYLYLTVKPVATNTEYHKDRNVNNPIITEFSVQYKKKEITAEFIKP